MKTAMQELWDYIDANIHEDGFNLYAAKEISIEKEKEQIEKAYNSGAIDHAEGSFQLTQYYNQNYNK